MSDLFSFPRRSFKEALKEESEEEEKADSVKLEDEEEEDENDDDGENFDEVYRGEILKPWIPINIGNAKPPLPLTVTKVNQTNALQTVANTDAVVSAEGQTSEEWLRTHSIEYQKLTLQDLVDKGKIGRLHPDKQTGRVNQHIQFDAMDVNEFEYRLNTGIEQYTKRIKWLLQGSKRVFGNVGGQKIGVCIDASEVSLGYGRLSALKESLIHLIDEQLSKRSAIYLMSFGSEIDPLWPVVRDVNPRVIEDAKEWAMRLMPSGGCNALKALKKVMKMKDLDTIVLILGSVPDQMSEILCEYSHQLGVGRNLPIHTVAYDCSDHMTNITLRNLADTSRGRYHCYTANCEVCFR
ncbi:von Willebrand factor A domain-containing protein 3A [Patella vulgata]|uniref:von Willebrand factor A domain-containing protein 3A n=1 Tax=Patella vulgata TaxID=6465 RepID=UPI0024A7C774|nr:von Willebrand factor A domain-containing protein 3A [Patella vulgata]